MPSPPTDPPARSRSANPAQVMLNSPLAASMRWRGSRLHGREQPRQRGRQVLAVAGTLLVHLVFLFSFVLGPAYPPPPVSDEPRDLLQVRLIEPPEPPPPPPVRGTPPKEVGPRHQGRSRRAVASRERSANVDVQVTRQAAAAAQPVVAAAATPSAPQNEPVAATKPPVSLPEPAPLPDLQPVPLAAEPPVVSLPEPTRSQPVPPKFQPEVVRPPQPEGNQPMPPPASLALPELPPQAAPSLSVPAVALEPAAPVSPQPISITPVRAEQPVAPAVPELQSVPLPAQPSPSVNLQASLAPSRPVIANQRPQVQAAAIKVAEVELAAVPLSQPAPSRLENRPAAARIELADAAPRLAPLPSIERPRQVPEQAADQVPSQEAPGEQLPTDAVATHAADEQVATDAAAAPEQPAGDDVSRAPDATPQGSDDAVPGQPDGVIDNPVDTPAQSDGPRTAAASPSATGHGTEGADAGTGPAAAGKAGGEASPAPGDYVQLKPRGDTDIMRHGGPDIGYRATRFDKDWTPDGESSIDTALRHAVEKTTARHTFHLPRGIRVECAVMPLLPIALLGCGNPDAPAEPLDPEIYKRLNAPPPKPLAPPPPPAASVAAPAPMIRLDNGAECAAARVAGGPLPPGCAPITLPPKPAAPASPSPTDSWVPASDQFH